MTEEAGHGLFDSLRKLAMTFVAVVETRLEIVASEIDEARVRLARIAVLAAVAGFCVAVAVNLLVLLIVVVFWDTNRLLAIGVLAGVFAAAAIAAALMLWWAMTRRPRLLSATLAELRKDRSKLEGR
jgi:uncharacterized membrane protein YqjE